MQAGGGSGYYSKDISTVQISPWVVQRGLHNSTVVEAGDNTLVFLQYNFLAACNSKVVFKP